MRDRFIDAEIGVFSLRVLPYQRDDELALTGVVAMQEFLPIFHIRSLMRRHSEFFEYEIVNLL